MVIVLCLSLCACSSSINTTKNELVDTAPNEPIALTTENIDDYISIRGEYKNGGYHSDFLYYTSTADLDIQAYSTVSGSFENVEITIRANLDDKAGAGSEKWHLADSDNEDSAEITFKLPASGEYTSSYSIECYRNTWTLSGSSDLEIISVSGTYVPNS